MQSICQMLDLDYQSSMLDFDVANRNNTLEPVEYDQWKGRTRTPLTADRSDAWVSSLNPQDADLYSSLAAPTLRRLGYQAPATRAITPAQRVQFVRQLQARKMRSLIRGLRSRSRR